MMAVLVCGACWVQRGFSENTTADKTGSPSEKFSFVQMCDTQLGMGGYEHDVATFKAAVKQINAMASKPDFVLVCGDLVNNADATSFADFKAVRAGFTLPCYCAAGNHDVGNEPTVESLKHYRETIGEDYYAVEHKGYTFVVANTQLWKAPVAGESEKHDAWFKKTLEAAKAKGRPVVVVVHYPLFVKEPDEPEAYFNLPLEKRREILALCETNGVVAFLAGHTHRSVINSHKGIQMVAGETTSKNFDERPMGFRLWQAGAATGLSHEFVALEGTENLPPQAVKPAAILKPKAMEKGGIVLTFDDRNFDDWLAVLPLFDKYGVKATFFISGDIDAKAVAAARQLVAKGHAIGSHGVHHLKAVEYGQEHSLEDYVKNEIQPQMDKWKTAGITLSSFGYPNSRSDAKTDAALLKVFRHLRTGASQKEGVQIRNMDIFFTAPDQMSSRGCLAGKGIDHMPDRPDRSFEQVDGALERAAEKNEILTLYAHAISETGKGKGNFITPAALEHLFQKARALKLPFFTYDQLP